MSQLEKIIRFIDRTCKTYNIDDSHGLGHSLEVLAWSEKLIKDQTLHSETLQVIYLSSILHDMCDKKYMNQDEGIEKIDEFLAENKMTPTEINVAKLIISTMSYSTVKKHGFPNLGPYKRAYHIVREADLLSAYDFDRCMIYNMHKRNGNLDEAFVDASKLFDNRVLKHNEDGLFMTDYSRQKSLSLELQSLQQMQTWRRLMKNNILV
jgi:HD superfamily phosphodiesterase